MAEPLEPRSLLAAPPMPHPNDPVLRDEHMAVFALVPTDQATDVSARDGAWSDPATWRAGHVPGPDAKVWIAPGTSVTVDEKVPDRLRWVLDEGTLRFAADRDTALTVETIVVGPRGVFAMGTPADPIHPDVSARITFADNGPIDPMADPTLVGRGLISHGTATIAGAPKTPFVPLGRLPRKGATQIRLATAPQGWRPGDRIVVAGTTPDGSDEATIRDVKGAVVTLSAPLQHDRPVPAKGLTVPVADLTRNVVFTSENTADVTRRGHVMFFHSDRVSVSAAGFVGLGRTNKLLPIDDPVIDPATGMVEPGTGTNPRGRYPVHFHRAGHDPGHPPATLTDSVVEDAPGWAIDNHSSHVEASGNVVYRAVGAAFVTEAGDELGAYRDNLAIGVRGSGEETLARRQVNDFGHEGDGFWLQGPGVEVSGNTVIDASHAGYILFTRGLTQAGLGVARFPADGLPPDQQSLAAGQASVEVGAVPLRGFADNTAITSGDALEIWNHQPAASGRTSVVSGLTGWNLGPHQGVFLDGSRGVAFQDIHLRSQGKRPAATGIVASNESGDLSFDGLDVSGYRTGLLAPDVGTTRLGRGTFRVGRAVEVGPTEDPTRVVRIDVRPRTRPLPGGGPRYDVFIDPTRTANPTDNPLGLVLFRGRPLTRSLRSPGSGGGTTAAPRAHHPV